MTLPSAAYAATSAFTITVGSLLGSTLVAGRLFYPVWAWVILFVALIPVGYYLVEARSEPVADGTYKIVNKRMFALSAVGAVMACVALVAVLVLA